MIRVRLGAWRYRAYFKQFVRAASRITHADPQAEFGALAIALAARSASTAANISGDGFVRLLTEHLDDSVSETLRDRANELIALIDRVVNSVNHGESTLNFAAALGLKSGVSGYI